MSIKRRIKEELEEITLHNIRLITKEEFNDPNSIPKGNGGSLTELVEHIIYRAEFNSGGTEQEKNNNSNETKYMIEQYTNHIVVEEFKDMIRMNNELGSIDTQDLLYRIEELEEL